MSSTSGPLSPENVYKRTESDSPEAAGKRLIRVYELAIEAADKRQPQGVRHSLDLLRNSFDPSASPEIVVSLARIYSDCEKLLEEENYSKVIEILETVKRLWEARLKIDSLFPR